MASDAAGTAHGGTDHGARRDPFGNRPAPSPRQPRQSAAESVGGAADPVRAAVRDVPGSVCLGGATAGRARRRRHRADRLGHPGTARQLPARFVDPRRAGRRRFGDRVPAADRHPVRLHPGDGAIRLHGARGVPDGPDDGPRRLVGPQLHPAALQLRLRHSRDHGDPRHRRPQGPADDDPDRTADDLFGTAAGLCRDYRRLYSAAERRLGHRAAGAGAAGPLRCRDRRRFLRRAGAAADGDQGQRFGLHHGAPEIPVAALARHPARAVAARVDIPAPRWHDHLHRHRGAVAAAELPQGRAGRAAGGRELRRAHRQRAARRARTDRLQPGDFARPDPGNGRARGRRILAGDDLRDQRRR